MKTASFYSICSTLHSAGVRFIVVGGLAVNAHGYLRLTADVDIVIQLVPHNIEQAFTALRAIGYQPAVPVTSRQFADPACRSLWIREKGMKVLKMWSDVHRETPLDIFIDEPFDFEKEWTASVVECFTEGGDSPEIPVHFVAIEALIRMKLEADRDTDRIDVRHLRMILENDRTA